MNGNYETIKALKANARNDLHDNLMYLHRSGDAFFKEVGGATSHERLLPRRIALIQMITNDWNVRRWLTEKEINEVVRETWEEFNENYR